MSYQLDHNPYGELISVTLPSGLVYSFQKIPLLGNSMVKYLPPWGNKRSLTYLLDNTNDVMETKTENYLPELFPRSIFLLRKEPFQTFITKGDFIHTTKKDEYGRLKLKSLSLNGRAEKMHQQSFEYVGPFLSKHTVINHEITHTIFDFYEEKLVKMTGNGNSIVTFEYDLDGNVVLVDLNGIAINYGYEQDRLTKAGLHQVVYDQNGFMVSKNGFAFGYNAKGYLISITDQSNQTTELSYSNDKLVEFSQAEEMWQLYYDVEDKLSHLYSVPNREYVYLHFDDEFGHIFAVSTQNVTYFVASDANGTPTEIFNEDGTSLKKISRTPFGLTLSEIGSLDFLPNIGFFGGIEFSNSGVVILNGNQPFDTHLGQFLTPQLKPIFLEKWTEISAIHSYRLPNPLKHQVNNMNNFEEWVALFGIKSPFLQNSKNAMTQLGIAKNVDFAKPQRKKANLCHGIATEFQLLGPNVILRLNQTTRFLIKSYHLQSFVKRHYLIFPSIFQSHSKPSLGWSRTGGRNFS